VIGQIGDAFLTYDRCPFIFDIEYSWAWIDQVFKLHGSAFRQIYFFPYRVTGKFKDAGKATVAAATAATAQNAMRKNSYGRSTKGNVAYEMPVPHGAEDDEVSGLDSLL
jgi:hypothetical protein